MYRIKDDEKVEFTGAELRRMAMSSTAVLNLLERVKPELFEEVGPQVKSIGKVLIGEDDRTFISHYRTSSSYGLQALDGETHWTSMNEDNFFNPSLNFFSGKITILVDDGKIYKTRVEKS
jgi:hypothetical protein